MVAKHNILAHANKLCQMFARDWAGLLAVLSDALNRRSAKTVMSCRTAAGGCPWRQPSIAGLSDPLLPPSRQLAGGQQSASSRPAVSRHPLLKPALPAPG